MPLLALVLLATLAPPATRAPARLAVLDNGRISLRFDLRSGSYDVVDRAPGGLAVRGAHAEMEGLSTGDACWKRSAATGTTRDQLGMAHALTITCAVPGRPSLLVEFRLYPGRSCVVVRMGTRAVPGAPWRLRRFQPLAGGAVEPGSGRWSGLRTLNAPSGAGQTEVRREPTRSSPNNLLLTFRQAGRRRAIVLGGLRTREFPKYAAFGPPGGDTAARRQALAGALPGARLVAYADCGGDGGAVGKGVEVLVEQGQPFTWDGAGGTAFGSVLFHEREVGLRIDGLKPAARYALGFSWWDFDGNGRVESVTAFGPDGGAYPLVAAARLPAGRASGKAAEERAVLVPPGAYGNGQCRLAFRNEAPVPNAVVSEVWLWEVPANAALPAEWTAGRPVTRDASTTNAPSAARLSLRADDPVGRLVRPGQTYWPDDSFYLDLGTSDPFVALEQYGRLLRLANDAHPNPYTFPTVCAWYAGVWQTPGAQNHPGKSKYAIATTPGLVEEMDCVRRSGFLRYSRVAGRIVPDNYTENNPQGWWDDAHWQREGFYVAPYETSQKWGKAMQAHGGLAFTYFQPAGPLPSRDFRVAHPEMLIGRDTREWIDYSSADTAAHMRGVYAAMRGAISGMMFDYCDELWTQVASHGRFADPAITAAAFYRTALWFGKDGLGRGSWIHERAIGNPPADLALGIADSQRTSGDTDRVDPAMIARSGLRWYKSRVVLAYDMDSKELNSAWKVPGYNGTDVDGRRMLLTMAYVAASRLLLANSFRDLAPAVLHDLSRTFPYPTEPRSARPVDAFVRDGWPRVYDFAVTPAWHQVTLLNDALPGRPETVSVRLSGEPADGALGLSPRKAYYVYDFWNDCLVGKLPGTAVLAQRLRSGEARMLSVREAVSHPQVLSTNRHVMQGAIDMARNSTWDAHTGALTGASRVVAGEPYRVVLALNGWRAAATSPGCRLEPLREGLAALVIERPRNETVAWRVAFRRQP